jgi:hypothetical protein
MALDEEAAFFEALAQLKQGHIIPPPSHEGGAVCGVLARPDGGSVHWRLAYHDADTGARLEHPAQSRRRKAVVEIDERPSPAAA